MRTTVIPLKKNYSKDKGSQRINGYIISLWKDWEKILPQEPKQCYLNVSFPHEIKGPHLHMQRWGQFACIQGKGRFIVKYGKGDYERVDVDCEINPSIVIIPPGTPCAIQNTGDDLLVIMNMPNPAWHPDNQDDHPVIYDDYQW
jgi:dTDP-4-dehydrorhamnose 3,5-epimerase-like enzyme